MQIQVEESRAMVEKCRMKQSEVDHGRVMQNAVE